MFNRISDNITTRHKYCFQTNQHLFNRQTPKKHLHQKNKQLSKQALADNDPHTDTKEEEDMHSQVTQAHRNTPLESHRGQSDPTDFADGRPGWAASPETPARRAASSATGAETLRPLLHGLVSEGVSEIQRGGRGRAGAEGESREGWGVVSRWLPSQFPVPHGQLAPGDPAPGAGRRAERREAGLSWRRGTEWPPGRQWTDSTTGRGGSTVTVHILLYGQSKVSRRQLTFLIKMKQSIGLQSRRNVKKCCYGHTWFTAKTKLLPRGSDHKT